MERRMENEPLALRQQEVLRPRNQNPQPFQQGNRRLLTNGAPAPTLLQKEVAVSDDAPFLLTKPDFSKMQVRGADKRTQLVSA